MFQDQLKKMLLRPNVGQHEKKFIEDYLNPVRFIKLPLVKDELQLSYNDKVYSYYCMLSSKSIFNRMTVNTSIVYRAYIHGSSLFLQDNDTTLELKINIYEAKKRNVILIFNKDNEGLIYV